MLSNWCFNMPPNVIDHCFWQSRSIIQTASLNRPDLLWLQSAIRLVVVFTCWNDSLCKHNIGGAHTPRRVIRTIPNRLVIQKSLRCVSWHSRLSEWCTIISTYCYCRLRSKFDFTSFSWSIRNPSLSLLLPPLSLSIVAFPLLHSSQCTHLQWINSSNNITNSVRVANTITHLFSIVLCIWELEIALISIHTHAHTFPFRFHHMNSALNNVDFILCLSHALIFELLTSIDILTMHTMMCNSNTIGSFFLSLPLEIVCIREFAGVKIHLFQIIEGISIIYMNRFVIHVRISIVKILGEY